MKALLVFRKQSRIDFTQNRTRTVVSSTRKHLKEYRKVRRERHQLASEVDQDFLLYHVVQNSIETWHLGSHVHIEHNRCYASQCNDISWAHGGSLHDTLYSAQILK
jgi:hypothetical protein